MCFSFVLGGILAGGCRFFCAQMLKFKIFLENSCVTKKLAYLYSMTNSQNNNMMNAQQLHGRFVNVTGKGFGEVIDFVIDGGDYNNNVVELVTILTADGRNIVASPKSCKVITYNEYNDFCELAGF